jgi:hypothetical protein
MTLGNYAVEVDPTRGATGIGFLWSLRPADIMLERVLSAAIVSSLDRIEDRDGRRSSIASRGLTRLPDPHG